GCVPRFEVEQEPGRIRVAVAGLADRARVEQPATCGQVDLGAACDVTADRAASVDDRQRYVAVPDDRDVGFRVADRVAGCLPGQHVFPDRVARARVVKTDAFPLRARLETGQELAGVVVEDAARPGSRRLRVAGEV